MLTAKEKTLLAALEQRAEEGVEIVTVEIVGSKKAPTIRVYIDCEGGVGFDQLSEAQRWIDAVMDELDPFPGAYTLEVSSPGIDRPLRTPDHFRRFAGETVQLQTKAQINGRSRWKGTLIGFEDGRVVLNAAGETFGFDLDDIKRANVKGAIDFNG